MASAQATPHSQLECGLDILLEEPFSALDHATCMRLQRDFGLTTVMVSHDISEVYKLSQRVVVIEHGRITDHGTPAEIFRAGAGSGKFSCAGEAQHLKQGDRVMLMSRAFNPMLVAVSQEES